MLGPVHRLVAVEDVGRLPKRETEVAPFERDVAEADRRAAGALLRLEPAGLGLNPGQRHARLDPPLDLDELELHVDGGRQLRDETF